jgi:hypothetical protein
MSGKYPGGFVTLGAPAGASVFFDGTGDYLTIPNNAALSLDTGDFCVEAWVYKTAASGNDWKLVSGGSSPLMFFGDGGTTSSRGLGWGTGSAGWVFTSGVLTPVNEWAHICFTRLSGVGRIFLNGYMRGYTASNTTNMTISAGLFWIGNDTSGYALQGYMSNLRVTKGSVPTVYQTSATTTSETTQIFVPPTQLFPITNTSLLTCQSPTIRDNSTNNFTLTVVGNTVVSNFTPFAGYTAGASGFKPALGAAAGGVWTLDEATTYQANRQWPIYDPSFNQTTLMLHGNSPTNQPFWIKDASINNFALTVVGDTKASNQTPFNTSWSNQVGSFNTVSNYIATSSTTLMNFGTAAYTIEFWIYLPSYGGGTGYVYGNNQTSGAPQTYINSNGQLVFQYVGSAAFATTTTAIALNTWTHVAIVRTSTSAGGFAVYFNGVNGLTNTDSTNVTATTALWIGNSGTSPMAAGLISNFRVCKGTAVYTSNFTPSSSPLTTTSQGATNCVLLTCQNGYFVDNAATPSTITLTNTPSIQYNNPFGSSLLTGGAGFFDGTGDYISLPSSIAFAFGTGDFTIECWAYATATTLNMRLWEFGNTFDNVGINSSSTIGKVSYYGTADNVSSTAPFAVNQWNHVAVSRVSGTSTLYINGVAAVSTSSTTNTSTARVFYPAGSTSSFQGYISNIRVVKGTAVYTANFTVPASPLTAIANTQLLSLQNTQPTNNSAFVDSSVNNFPITRLGNTTQGTFSPFTQTGWALNITAGSDNSNFIATPTSANLRLDQGNWTIEFWLWISAFGATNNRIWDTGANSSALTIQIGYGDNGAIGWGRPTAGTGVSAPAGTVTTNRWYHVVMTSSGAGTNGALYINGVLVAGPNNYTNTTATSSPFNIGRNNVNAADHAGLIGYISNFRFVSGQQLYTSSFIPDTRPLTATTYTTDGGVTYRSITGACQLLTCQQNRFMDSSANNFAMTVNGTNPSVQAFSPFVPTVTTPTTYSNKFDGSSYMYTASSAAFNLGLYTSWTMEGFVYMPSIGGGNFNSFFVFNSGSDHVLIGFLNTSTNVYLQINGTAYQSSTPLNIGQWNHVAAVRNAGSTVALYLNGVQLLTAANLPVNSNKITYIGGNGSSNYYGNISNLRIVTGTALYTGSTYTVPTAALTAISGTQLLTCQNSTISDSSSNAFTFTISGTIPVVASPTPFPAKVDQTTLNTAYSTSLVGGSAYFDGTGDYLSGTNANISGSVAFTVEAWIYLTSSTANRVIFSNSSTTGGTSGILFWLNGSSFLTLSRGNGGAGTNVIGTTALTLNTWNHVAATRTAAGVITVFTNGVPNGTGTDAALVDQTSYVVGAAYTNSAVNLMQGYISGLRVLSGTALYSSAFAPPLAPPTPVANTSFLLNSTNAGIIDNTAKNAFETLGTAQISTAQSKYGGSSISLPSSGAYCKAPSSNNWAFGTGDFTVECWSYKTTSTSYSTIISVGNAAGGLGIAIASDASIIVTRPGTAIDFTFSAGLTLNAWYHIVISRSGTSLRCFVNGVQVGTTQTSSTNYASSYLNIGIDGDNTSQQYIGYIDDLRITKAARYTSNFTPPTSQLQDQ